MGHIGIKYPIGSGSGGGSTFDPDTILSYFDGSDMFTILDSDGNLLVEEG